jgi:AhpD family alkylhydroperoxidase
METRIKIDQVEPNTYQAMLELEKYTGATALDPYLKTLIKIRASQINGCAYCIQMHAEQARKLGESENWIYAICAWKESPLFTEVERSVLAVTEDVTLISDNGLSKKVYDQALGFLGKEGLAQCIMQVVTINAWNRIAVATSMRHE